MKLILTLFIAGALAAACTVTSTFANPNCEKYSYLRVCADNPRGTQ